MTRLQWGLAALLLAQLVLLVLIGRGAGDGEAQSARPLLADFDPARAKKIRILEPEERSLVLERDGEAWRIDAAEGFPADAERVGDLFEDLEQIEVRRPIARSPRYHEALEVAGDKFERRVTIWSDDDSPQVDLLIGSSPSFGVSHLRLQGDDRVWEVRGLRPYDLRAEAATWIRRSFVDLDEEQVVAVGLRNSHGHFEIRRDGEGWRLDGEAENAENAFDVSKTSSFVRSVTSLRVSEPAGPVDAPLHGYDSPAATLEITYREPAAPSPGEAVSDEEETAATTSEAPSTESEAVEESEVEPVETRRLTILLGKPLEGETGKRYASRSDFSYSVVLGQFDAEKLTEKKLADLLEVKPAG